MTSIARSTFYRLLLILCLLFSFSANGTHAEPRGPATDFDEDYIDFLFSPARPVPRSEATPRTGTSRGERSTRQRVAYPSSKAPGSIDIDTQARALFLIEPGGWAQRYEIGVGREGFGWYGTENVTAKREWPDWRPPASMRARQPGLPEFMPGGPDNPMGARALYLGHTLYRIHGSNDPETVGEAASAGCFRMTNTDVIDLYLRVRIGTQVRVF